MMFFLFFGFFIATVTANNSSDLNISFKRTGLKSGSVFVESTIDDDFVECKLRISVNGEALDDSLYIVTAGKPSSLPVDGLIPDNFYQFRLDCLNFSNLTIISNAFGYQLSYLKPNLNYELDYKTFELKLNWTISEPIEITRFGILYTQSSIYSSSVNYFYNSTGDYDDDNEISLITINSNECFWECFNRTQCLAFAWSFQNSSCHLKTDLSRPKSCGQLYTCGIISEYKTELVIAYHSLNVDYCYQVFVRAVLGFNGEYSEKVCFSINLNPSIKTEGNFIENQNASLICDFDDLNGLLQVEDIKWFKDGRLINETKLNVTLLDNGHKLNFKTLIHEIHIGHYFCVVQLPSGNQMNSQSNFELLIPFPPSLRILTPPVVYYNESNYVNVQCFIEGYPVPNITMAHLDKNQTQMSGYINQVFHSTNITLYMSLINVDRKFNGTYVCYMLADPTIRQEIDIIITARPEAPVIVEAKTYSTKSYVSWNVPVTVPTNSELNGVLLEWTTDFYDILNEPFSRYYSYKDLEGKNELYLNIALPNGTFIRLTAFNRAGPSKPSEIRSMTFVNEKQHTSKTYFIPFLITATLLVLIIVIFLTVAIYKYKFSSSSTLSPMSIDTKRLFSFKNIDK